MSAIQLDAILYVQGDGQQPNRRIDFYSVRQRGNLTTKAEITDLGDPQKIEEVSAKNIYARTVCQNSGCGMSPLSNFSDVRYYHRKLYLDTAVRERECLVVEEVDAQTNRAFTKIILESGPLLCRCCSTQDGLKQFYRWS